MSETFNAFVLNKDEGGFSAGVQQLTLADLPEGDITVRVQYSSVNFKDGLACLPESPVVYTYPMVPGIDLAGTVVESSNPRFTVGQEVLAEDRNPAPAIMREESPATGQSTADVSIERYFSKDWHDREVEHVWRRCWQLACRVEEIPNVGDHVVYEIVHDSLIVVRSAPDEIRAYVNSCLHRGTMLRTEGGCVQRLRCPFHAWTWKLDGSIVHIPQQWDLPDIDPADLHLPEAKVGTWGGFVFVNFDLDAEPLESYLENLPEHFAAFKLEDRYKAAHVAKIMPCNWKLAMEAFVEAYHVGVAHPQVLAYYGDTNTQYDVWPGVRHVSRMISVQGLPSPSMKGIASERTIEEMRRDVPFFAGKPIEVAEGERARDGLARRARERISRATHLDLSELSDTESLDLIEYMLFPNMVPWGGQALPIVGDVRDPDSVAAAVAQTVEQFGAIDLCVNNASAINLGSIEEAIKRTPVGRMGKPEDIAAACAFFISEEAGYITGQILGVNGGRNT